MMHEIVHRTGDRRAALILSHAGLRPATYQILDVEAPVLVRDALSLPDGLALVPSPLHVPAPFFGVSIDVAGYVWDRDILYAVEEEHNACRWQPTEPVEIPGAADKVPLLIGWRGGVMVALVCPMVRR